MAQQKGNGSGVLEFATGSLVAKSNIKVMVMDSGMDLAAEDDATREAVERIMQIVQPLMYQVVTATGSSDVVNGQTEVNYDGTGSNGSFVGGDGEGVTAYVVADVITLSDGTEVTVDAIDANGDVTEFTITSVGGAFSSEGAVLTHSSLVGTGDDTSFTLTLGGDNVAGGGGVIHAVVDGSHFDAASIQERVRAIGVDNVNGKDFTTATVTEGTSLTVA